MFERSFVMSKDEVGRTHASQAFVQSTLVQRRNEPRMDNSLSSTPVAAYSRNGINSNCHLPSAHGHELQGVGLCRELRRVPPLKMSVAMFSTT